MSDILRTAAEVIASAEKRLRQLMEAAIARQEYSQVARLASIADGLLNVLKAARNGNSNVIADAAHANAIVDRVTPSIDFATAAISTGSRDSEVGYPRFERQGDRLIKIAWSKKDRREYEHRATADIIFRIAELFERDRSQGTPFMMDNLMPFRTRTGADIPSYQAYLALAWLRSLGMIETRGKDGYAVVVENLRNRVEAAWDGLPDVLRR